MMRIVSHQSFHCAILITLFHPLSTNCRSKLINMSNQNQSPSQPIIITDNMKNIPLELNIVRKAWDCLYEYNTQKNIILMSYINYLLIETLCSMPVDDHYYSSTSSSNITNNDIIQCEIKEDYVSKDKIGSSSIHSIISLSDQPKMNSIQILQALYILPNATTNNNMEGKNNHVDNSSSGNSNIVDINEITIDMIDLMLNPRKDNNLILDETNPSEVYFRPFLVTQDSNTINNTTIGNTTRNITTATSTTTSNNNHIRVKLGRNDMLQPKASVKASELLYSDPLSLTSLYKLGTLYHIYSIFILYIK